MSAKETVEGLAALLKAAREAAGLSQLEAAERSGVHHVSINRFEKENRSPTIATLYKLAKAYRVSVCALLPSGQLEDDGKATESNPASKKATSKKGKN